MGCDDPNCPEFQRQQKNKDEYRRDKEQKKDDYKKSKKEHKNKKK